MYHSSVSNRKFSMMNYGIGVNMDAIYCILAIFTNYLQIKTDFGD